MTPEQQRIAIAELCGWSNIHQAENGTSLMGWWSGPPRTSLVIPDYLNDLNAMHEAEKVLTTEQLTSYLNWLDITCGGELELSAMVEGPEYAFGLLHATAAQRAEAFLRTLNKYTDEH